MLLKDHVTNAICFVKIDIYFAEEMFHIQYDSLTFKLKLHDLWFHYRKGETP